MVEKFTHFKSGFPDQPSAESWLKDREVWLLNQIDRERFSISTSYRQNTRTELFEAQIEANDIGQT